VNSYDFYLTRLTSSHINYLDNFRRFVLARHESKRENNFEDQYFDFNTFVLGIMREYLRLHNFHIPNSKVSKAYDKINMKISNAKELNSFERIQNTPSNTA